MPRKFFRRYLPSHDSIQSNRYISPFGHWLHHPNLWHLNRRSVAGGVAVGMFAGLVPGSNPAQFAAAALLAVLFRVNLPIAAVVTLYSNPFTVVPIYYAAFKLGQLVLMQSGDGLPDVSGVLEGKSMHEWLPTLLDWLAHVGKPLLVGLPLLALLLAAVGYVVVDWGWRVYITAAWRRRKRQRARNTP